MTKWDLVGIFPKVQLGQVQAKIPRMSRPVETVNMQIFTLNIPFMIETQTQQGTLIN